MMAIDYRYDEEDVDGAMSFQEGEITTSTQSNPTNDSKAHQEAIYQDTNREFYKPSTNILLKLPIESAPMKATRGSQKQTSKHNYRMMMNLRVNAKYR
jgi:hypothetical protein